MPDPSQQIKELEGRLATLAEQEAVYANIAHLHNVAIDAANARDEAIAAAMVRAEQQRDLDVTVIAKRIGVSRPGLYKIKDRVAAGRPREAYPLRGVRSHST
jgi:hypothetical protein